MVKVKREKLNFGNYFLFFVDYCNIDCVVYEFMVVVNEVFVFV